MVRCQSLALTHYSDTPKTTREILPVLMQLIMSLLGSEEEEQQEVCHYSSAKALAHPADRVANPWRAVQEERRQDLWRDHPHPSEGHHVAGRPNQGGRLSRLRRCHVGDAVRCWDATDLAGLRRTRTLCGTTRMSSFLLFAMPWSTARLRSGQQRQELSTRCSTIWAPRPSTRRSQLCWRRCATPARRPRRLCRPCRRS